VPEVGGEVPGLLRRPCLGWVRGDAGDVQAPGVVFEEHQCVETFAECGVDVEEVRRDDALGLGGEELPPGRPGTARGRVDARVMQDLPDRRAGDPVAEPGQFALDPPVTPPWVLLGEPQHERCDRSSCRWASGASARGVVPLTGHESAMPGEQGARCHREDLRPPPAIHQPGQCGEPEPIRGLIADRTRQLPAKDRVFVPQHEQFGILRCLAASLPRCLAASLPRCLAAQQAPTERTAISGSPCTAETRSPGHALRTVSPSLYQRR
jgi:hypothetical protein